MKVASSSELDPPACLPPNPRSSRPRIRAPEGSWDTHFHIFGPPEKYPYYPARKYTPPAASLDAYRSLCDLTGLQRGVCVQPNLHGTDNRVTLDAVERSDGRFLAIIKVENNVTYNELKQFDSLGARGVRFAFNPEHGGEFDPDLFRRISGWAGELGWCIDLHLAPPDLDSLYDAIRGAEANIVIDHMARIDPASGLDQRPFQTLLELAKLKHVWVKLSGADRITRNGPPYSDVSPFAEQLIAQAAERMLWGSDWPHSAYFDPRKIPDDGQLFDFLTGVTPSDDLLRRILIDNPRRLFGGGNRTLGLSS